MSLPDAASLEVLSLAELRDLMGVLVVEVRRLQSDNAALRAANEAQQATITALRAENQALRDEVARLKGLPPRPPSRPSGMEKATEPGVGVAGEASERSKRRRGAKRDRDAVTSERVLKAAVPAGSRFKGYEDVSGATEGWSHRGARAAPLGRGGALPARALADAAGRDRGGALAGGDRRRLARKAPRGRSCGASSWPRTPRGRSGRRLARPRLRPSGWWRC